MFGAGVALIRSRRALGSKLGGLLLLAACSSDKPPTTADAGGGASTGLPVLPRGCDDALPQVALGPPRKLDDSSVATVRAIRAVGNTVFYLGPRGTDAGTEYGIFAVDVPDGVPELLVTSPDGVEWEDFWITDDLIVAIAQLAIYTAPRSGGEAVLAAGMVGRGDVAEHAYARMNGFLYAAFEGYSEPTQDRILRAPWPAGEFSRVTAIRGIPLPAHTFIPGASSLFYNDDDRVLALFDDGSLNEVWTGGVALGENDGLYVKPIGCPSFSLECLLRITPGSTAVPVPIALPWNVSLPGIATASDWGSISHPVLVSFHGDGYFVAPAHYTLPDDGREVMRPALMRIRAGSQRAELVRCIPPPPFDPPLPSSLQGAEVDDIAATDAGVFVLRMGTWTDDVDLSASERLLRNEQSEPYAVKVWP